MELLTDKIAHLDPDDANDFSLSDYAEYRYQAEALYEDGTVMTEIFSSFEKECVLTSENHLISIQGIPCMPMRCP